MEFIAALFAFLFLFQILWLLGKFDRKRLKKFVTNRSNRNLFYIGFMMICSNAVSVLAVSQRSNWIFFLGSICAELYAYFALTWLKLSTTSNSKVQKVIVVRPQAAKLIIVTCLFELGCFYLAGPEEFQNILTANDQELIHSNWLTIGIIATLIYVIGCVLVFLKETIQVIRNYRGTNKARYTYSYSRFVLCAALALMYFGTYLIGLSLFALTGWNEVDVISKQIQQVAFGLFSLFLIPLGLLSPLSLRVYEKVDRLVIRKRSNNPDLRWLYEQSLEIFPASYKKNAYLLAEAFSPAWLLNSVIKELLDTRTRLLTVETQRKAEERGLSLQDIAQTRRIRLKKEASVWAYYLNNDVNISQANKLLTEVEKSVDVPQHKYVGTDYLISYYIKLASEVKRQLRQPLIWSNNKAVDDN